MRQAIVSTLLVLSSMAAAQVTDYHAHAITDSYRELVAKHNMLLDEGFPLPQWSAEAHLQMMSEAGIDRAILTVPAPHPYFGDQTECDTACRLLNEELARLVESQKSKVESRKIVKNGQILILRGDKTYTITGLEIRE